MTRTVTLEDVVISFAEGLKNADAARPFWTSRSGRSYQPGIGPHPEDEVVRRVLALSRLLKPIADMQVPYPDGRQSCDLVIGDSTPQSWWIEVKMARLAGDNGKPDDTSIKDILSPYATDHSALTDCVKLLSAPKNVRRAVLIYGFDWLPKKPIAVLLDAFESLASTTVALSPRVSSSFSDLVHPVHSSGLVAAWRIEPKT